MTTATMNYAASAALTITLASLTDGSWRQSAVVDNASNKYVDVLLGGKITVGSVAPTDGSTIDIWAYGEKYDGGGGSSEYTAGASGSDAAYTADGEEDELFFVTSITVDTSTSVAYEFGPIALAQVFGGALPRKWGLVIENNTGQTLDTTGSNFALYYTGVKYDAS